MAGAEVQRHVNLVAKLHNTILARAGCQSKRNRRNEKPEEKSTSSADGRSEVLLGLTKHALKIHCMCADQASSWSNRRTIKDV